jgi:hypothetical protein
MGWKFISGEQAEKKTKVKGNHDLVQFIVGSQSREGRSGIRTFDSAAIVKDITTFLKRNTEGLPEEDRAALEATLHTAITKVLRM